MVPFGICGVTVGPPYSRYMGLHRALQEYAPHVQTTQEAFIDRPPAVSHTSSHKSGR